MEIGVIVAIIVAMILVFFILQYNSIKSLEIKVKQSKSGIDVALTKRFDLIPNLVECVKGYCTHEEKVLEEVTKVRTEYMKNKNLIVGEDANKKTYDVLMLAEKYPELKASSNFLELQTALERTENSLSAARRLYNSDVTMLNTKIQTFPGNIVAAIIGVKQQDLFKADEPAKEKIKVDF